MVEILLRARLLRIARVCCYEAKAEQSGAMCGLGAQHYCVAQQKNLGDGRRNKGKAYSAS